MLISTTGVEGLRTFLMSQAEAAAKATTSSSSTTTTTTTTSSSSSGAATVIPAGIEVVSGESSTIEVVSESSAAIEVVSGTASTSATTQLFLKDLPEEAKKSTDSLIYVISLILAFVIIGLSGKYGYETIKNRISEKNAAMKFDDLIDNDPKEAFLTVENRRV